LSAFTIKEWDKDFLLKNYSLKNWAQCLPLVILAILGAKISRIVVLRVFRQKVCEIPS
jgi:hypothetical protein